MTSNPKRVVQWIAGRRLKILQEGRRRRLSPMNALGWDDWGPLISNVPRTATDGEQGLRLFFCLCCLRARLILGNDFFARIERTTRRRQQECRD